MLAYQYSLFFVFLMRLPQSWFSLWIWKALMLLNAVVEDVILVEASSVSEPRQKILSS